MVTTKGAAKAPHGSGNARNASTPAAKPAVAPGRLLRVTHDTEYRYAARVESAQHQARLQPLVTPRQQVLSFALDIDPAPESVGTEIDAFGKGTKALAHAIADSEAFSIAGGGDTLAAIAKYAIAERIDYISTGGGAFLEFLEGKTLPAVQILESRA